MNLKAYLLEEDRGVSPVIGVILMVAITVILAAVVATFVMNMGPPKDQAPTAKFSFTTENTDSDAAPEQVVISHNGGEAVPAAELSTEASDPNNSPNTPDWGSSGDVTAGTSVTVDLAGSGSGNGLNDATIKVIWNSQQTDKSDVLATWTGQDA